MDAVKGQGKKDDGNDKKKNKKNKEDRDKKKEKKVKKDKSPKKPGTTSTGGAVAGDDKEKQEATEKRTGAQECACVCRVCRVPCRVACVNLCCVLSAGCRRGHLVGNVGVAQEVHVDRGCGR